MHFLTIFPKNKKGDNIFLADGHRRVNFSGELTIYCSFQTLVPLILLLFFYIQIASLMVCSSRNGNLLPLRERCPYSEYSNPYFPTFGLNTDQINSKYGYLLRSVHFQFSQVKKLCPYF